MEALASYSKYLGCYDKWQEIRRRYLIRWSNGNESFQGLQRFFDENMSLDYMIDKVKEMMGVLPKPMALIIRHALLMDYARLKRSNSQNIMMLSR